MEDTVILGMTDTKTPYLEEGVALLKQRNYTPVVRHAGGLAVVSNSGVLNISLLFSRQNATITQVYEWMQELITRAFPEAIGEKEILAFEVSDSYCPGDYDLVSKGKNSLESRKDVSKIPFVFLFILAIQWKSRRTWKLNP